MMMVMMMMMKIVDLSEAAACRHLFSYIATITTTTVVLVYSAFIIDSHCISS